MRNQADLLVVLGAFMVAVTGVEQGAKAACALAEGRYLVAAAYAFATFGSCCIAFRVWKAA